MGTLSWPQRRTRLDGHVESDTTTSTPGSSERKYYKCMNIELVCSHRISIFL